MCCRAHAHPAQPPGPQLPSRRARFTARSMVSAAVQSNKRPQLGSCSAGCSAAPAATVVAEVLASLPSAAGVGAGQATHAARLRLTPTGATPGCTVQGACAGASCWHCCGGGAQADWRSAMRALRRPPAFASSSSPCSCARAAACWSASASACTDAIFGQIMHAGDEWGTAVRTLRRARCPAQEQMLHLRSFPVCLQREEEVAPQSVQGLLSLWTLELCRSRQCCLQACAREDSFAACNAFTTIREPETAPFKCQGRRRKRCRALHV
jgi:hypothetical protein